MGGGIMRCSQWLLIFMLSATLARGQEAIEQTVPANVTPTFKMTQDQQDEFRDVAEMLRCPTCQGLSVLESDAAFSLQIQARVKEQIAEGKSREQILEYFTERYGNWILREPPREGVNLLAWLFPIGLLVMGPVMVWFFVWRRRKVVFTTSTRSREELLVEFEQLIAEVRAKKGASV
jgi:cytochrome c-type biogenesis protein CcmH